MAYRLMICCDGQVRLGEDGPIVRCGETFLLRSADTEEQTLEWNGWERVGMSHYCPEHGPGIITDE